MEPETRLKSTKEFQYYKRNLPHFELPGSFYFVTFNTAKTITLSDEAKEIVFASVKYHDDKKYKLHACVVMETHVHIILQPLEESAGTYYSLAQILHSVKSYSSHKIKNLLNLSCNIWMDENYDRFIRDSKDYLEKVDYIIYNPMKAGIVDKYEDYKWLFYKGSGQY